ncbi:hypothetical protein KP509_13G063400 [Ceratopteris richardii]|uniref:Uncharacterized protein n=1 Tax=Ceratopteris richardii TaxID=49495 RepID=A0A8T2TG74_CERRI|nr:hypothetical protein KP509_13G063400 [Ceratopteris richardii]KAH7421550.1 hypothetical protein KP509_13G063400 [Ceratopteris richardii]
MVDWWWGLVGAALPAAAVQHVWRMRKRKKEQRQSPSIPRVRDRGIVSSPSPVPVLSEEVDAFACERVCTSKRMLNKLGAFAKDQKPSDTCVTVCGSSRVDACSDACVRAICSNQHHIPNWNDICLRRCQNQCLQFQQASP